MNKPILAIVPKNGAAAKIIERTHTGIIVSIKDDGAVYSVLNEYYENWITKRKVPFIPNLDEIQKYDAKSLTKCLSEVFKGLLGGRPVTKRNCANDLYFPDETG